MVSLPPFLNCSSRRCQWLARETMALYHSLHSLRLHSTLGNRMLCERPRGVNDLLNSERSALVEVLHVNTCKRLIECHLKMQN